MTRSSQTAMADKSRDVSHPVGDVDDLNRSRLNSVDDQVVSDGPEEEGPITSPICAPMSHAGSCRECPHLVLQLANPGIGRVNTVFERCSSRSLQDRAPHRARGGSASCTRAAALGRLSANRCKHGFAIQALATIKRSNAAIHFRVKIGELGDSRVFLILQEPERFTNNLTPGGVSSRTHLGLDELLQLGCQ